MNRPKVSVCLITYNHEKYIRECLDGAVSQIVNFDFEIIIGDDCSSDMTKQICLEFSYKYPTLIKYSKRSNNLGMIGNWVATISECNGKYIALCEGDDYWTDPYKLQKQVDFLENNEDFVLTFHPVSILHPDGQLRDDHITKVPQNYETIDMLALFGNYIHTPSVVYRNVLKIFPESFHQTPIGDYFLYMLLAQYGKLKKLDDNMAVYRYGVGVHSSGLLEERVNKIYKTYELLYDTIDDQSIKELFLMRILLRRFYSLPRSIRNIDSFDKLHKTDVLFKVLSIKDIYHILLYKLIYFFKKLI